MTEIDEKAFSFKTEKYVDLFLTLLEKLEQNNIIPPKNVNIYITGGEITVLAGKKNLLNYALDHPDYTYTIFTNAVVYDEKLAMILANNSNNCLVCDFDAGTPETYHMIKGFNYFNRVTNNLKSYMNFTAKKQKYNTIKIKYIVLPDLNTSNKDYMGTINLLKELKLNNIYLSKNTDVINDKYYKRKCVYEIARFKKLLENNEINAYLWETSFNNEDKKLIDRYYKQMA